MNCKNPHAKSCIRVYNETIQGVTADPTTLQLEGVVEVDSGCSMTLRPSSVQVNRPGLYHFSADVEATFGADLPVVQLYLDNEPVASAIARIPVSAADLPIHLETELGINPCCQSRSKLSLKVTGGEAKVTRISFGALKLA